MVRQLMRQQITHLVLDAAFESLDATKPDFDALLSAVARRNSPIWWHIVVTDRQYSRARFAMRKNTTAPGSIAISMMK